MLEAAAKSPGDVKVAGPLRDLRTEAAIDALNQGHGREEAEEGEEEDAEADGEVDGEDDEQ